MSTALTPLPSDTPNGTIDYFIFPRVWCLPFFADFSHANFSHGRFHSILANGRFFAEFSHAVAFAAYALCE